MKPLAQISIVFALVLVALGVGFGLGIAQQQVRVLLCEGEIQIEPFVIEGVSVNRVACRIFVPQEPAATPTEPRQTPIPTEPIPTEPVPTDTIVPTEPVPTDTIVPTEPVPTNTVVPTEPPPSGHDVTYAHSDVIDGHSHGMTLDQIPAGAVRDYLVANPDLYVLGEIVSGPHENEFPFVANDPHAGKHEGNVFWFFEARNNMCHQFQSSGTSNDNCLKALWIRVHSMAIGAEVRAPFSEHSVLVVAEICNQGANGALGNQCGVVELTGVENYGEVHSMYKKTGCLGIPDGIYHPSQYSVNGPNPDNAQVPYVANQGRGTASSPLKLFWNSQRNQVLEASLPVNNLFQIAWTEHAFGTPSQNLDLCADPANDLVQFDSTDDGMKRIFVFWTLQADLDGFSRPDAGFVDREGNEDPSCTETGPACFPFFIGAGVPAGDAFYNLQVRNAGDFTQEIIHPDSPFAVPVDVTVPGWFRPGAPLTASLDWAESAWSWFLDEFHLSLDHVHNH